MSIIDRLDEIEARANAADRAGVFESDYPTWAAWEAAWDSSTDVPALVAALRAVLVMHQPRWYSNGTKKVVICRACGDTPCATVRAIEAALS